MGWAEKANKNPDKGKIKPRKPDKAEVDREIKAAVLAEFIRRMTPNDVQGGDS
jgi:hypothetical protein